jgi:hypothetical protein
MRSLDTYAETRQLKDQPENEQTHPSHNNQHTQEHCADENRRPQFLFGTGWRDPKCDNETLGDVLEWVQHGRPFFLCTPGLFE